MKILKRFTKLEKLSAFPFLYHDIKRLNSIGGETGRNLKTIFTELIRMLNYAFFSSLYKESFSYLEVANSINESEGLSRDEKILDIHMFLIKNYPSPMFDSIERRKFYYPLFLNTKPYANPIISGLLDSKNLVQEFQFSLQKFVDFLFEKVGLTPYIEDDNFYVQAFYMSEKINLEPFVIKIDDEYSILHFIEDGKPYYRVKGETVEVVKERVIAGLAEYFEKFLTPKIALALWERIGEREKVLNIRYLDNAIKSISKEKYQEAIENFELYMYGESRNYLIEYLIAYSYYKIGKVNESISSLKRLIKDAPSFYYPYLTLMDIFSEIGNIQGAIEVGEKLYDITFDKKILSKFNEIKKLRAKGKEKEGNLRFQEMLGIELEDPGIEIIGRDEDIDSSIEILSSYEKNNLMILGEPGVGKTTLVYGILRRIQNEDVPFRLLSKKIFKINPGFLVSGTKFRGQLEERILKLLEKVKSERGILFIDDIHYFLGGDALKSSNVDFAALIKPYIEKREVQFIFATTFEEYSKISEKISLFSTHFQKLNLKELDFENVKKIMKSKAEEFERFYFLSIDIDSINKHLPTVKMLFRDRFLPDKSIELLDRACAKVNMEFESGKRDNGIVGEIDFLRVVSKDKGIELSTISESLTEKLKTLEEKLTKKIIGQEKAISELVRKIIPSRLGFKINKEKPDGVFLFVGPTGVGKTETAKVLAEILFGSKEKLLRIDMSEYMEEYTYSRLIGAAPGYVGYYDSNQLTDEMRKDPYRVLLLDEMEKAHPQLINIFLQVFDAGVLTDARGKKAYFDNTIIIMTSNVGTSLFSKTKVGFSSKKGEVGKEELIKEVKKHFPPEFLNRVDAVIFFESLTLEDMKKIVDLKIEELNENLKPLELRIKLTDKAKEVISKRGYSLEYGARNLIRTIEQQILEPLSKEKLKEDLKGEVVVDYDEKERKFVFLKSAGSSEEEILEKQDFSEFAEFKK